MRDDACRMANARNVKFFALERSRQRQKTFQNIIDR
jgi:hypothetical protein